MSAQSYVESHMHSGKGESYDRRYESDPHHRYLWSREQEVLLEIAKRHHRDRGVDLLDFACGTGRILSCMEGQVRSATGVDVSESMLGMAERKLGRSTLVRANLLEEEVLRGRSFNLITAFRFFVNAEQELRVNAMRALRPLLADDGIMVINDHQNPASLRWGYHRLRRRCRRDCAPVNLWPVREVHELARATGFKVVETISVGLAFLPKLELPAGLCRWCDRLAGSRRLLAQVSESPVFVLRKAC